MPDQDKTSSPNQANQVALEQIWKQRVKNEIQRSKDWEKNWSYQLYFDAKGQPKDRNVINLDKFPEAKSVYSKKLPHNVSGEYGRVKNPALLEMEFKSFSENRKCRTLLSDYAGTIY